MLKSLNIAVNDNCNHLCNMCSIWKNERQPVLSVEFMKQALARNPASLSEVFDLSITGGEPFLRKDMFELTEAILQNLPKIEIVFVNTNGSMPDRAISYAQKISSISPKTIISVSLDGDREIHKNVRGVDAYDKAVRTIKGIHSLNIPNVSAMISTTITDPGNALYVLNHMQKLSEEIGCDYTFRVAEISETYYKNQDFSGRSFTEEDIRSLENFIIKHKGQDPFLPYVIEHMRTKKNSLMIEDGVNHCLAGDAFLFVQANGIIRPCIHSQRSIGHLSQGIKTGKIDDLGKHEPCPCCTECTVYPMLHASGMEHTKI